MTSDELNVMIMIPGCLQMYLSSSEMTAPTRSDYYETELFRQDPLTMSAHGRGTWRGPATVG